MVTLKLTDQRHKNISNVELISDEAVHRSPVAIFVVDLKGSISYANPAFLKLHDMKNPLAVKRIKVFAHQQFVKSGVSRAIKKSLGGKTVELDDVPYEVVHDQRKYLHFHMTPMKNQNGKIDSCLVLAEDVTDSVLLQRKLKEYNKDLQREVDLQTHQLKQANKQLHEEIALKDELFNITSHELRTPLISVMGFLDLLLKGSFGQVSKRQQTPLTTINRNINRLNDRINEFIDFSRLQAGRVSFHRKKSDLAPLLIHIEKQFHHIAKQKNLKLSISRPSSKLMFKGDAARLKQALVYLIANAISFTKKGSVTVKTSKKQDNVIIDLIDTGISIPKKYHSKIFTRFFQVESSMTREHEGVGLGLPIAQYLIQGQGGNLTLVDSRPKKGSHFRILLPIKK